MKRYPLAALLCCSFFVNSTFHATAQSVPCPSNIDFELGNFTNWQLFTGTCCAINTPTLGVVAGRHTITSGTTNDAYGGFPIVSPGGLYSLKLGNNSVGAQAERAKYYVHVPAGVNNYSLIFRYAVVFQDPSHTSTQQPRFEVKAYDSITNAIVNCSQFTYVATSNLPGFALSSLGSNVWYKGWTTASINMSGYAGRTVVVDFASGDCALGGHFGYGYIDLDCGLFKINTTACNSNPFTTLSAPPGFQSYIWKDSTLTTTVGTGQNVSIATPSSTTKYAVILIPYTGYGCPDTLYTTVTVSNINLNAKDTAICIGSSAILTSNASGTGTPYIYTWTPSTALSCTNCANPITTTTANRTYYVSVTNTDGCTRLDTVNVRVSNMAVALSRQHVSCYGMTNGSITATPSGGIAPYTYSWNSNPVQTTANATGLNARGYTVTVTDSIGCMKTTSDTITQPAVLTIIKGAITHVSCSGGNNGTAVITAMGGTPPYSYSWSNAANTNAVSGLSAGIYTVTVTDSKGCTTTDSVIITQPTLLTTTTTTTNVFCNGGNNGSATTVTNGGTIPYSYSWNTIPVKTAATATTLSAGAYIVTVTDNKGCVAKDTVIISQPSPLNAIHTQTNVLCNGSNTGSTAVNVSGGTTPYIYTWNTNPAQTTPVISGLSSGTYIATITDNKGCVIKDTTIITQPLHLNSVISKTDVSCYNGNNGTATVVVNGGVSPYTYSWSTNPKQTFQTAIGLSSGQYIVSISDSNNCSISDTIDILQPTPLIGTHTKTDVSCFNGNNGTATINVAGGTTPYTYSWNTVPLQATSTATTLPAGIYTVLTTDQNGCTRLDSIVVSQPTRLTTSTSHTDVSCFNGNNGTATVVANGGTLPYTYLWNTSPQQTGATATNLTAGNKTILVTDGNGCTKTDTVTITQPTSITSGITALNVNCFGGNNGSATLSVAGGTPPYSYIWNTNPPRTTNIATGLSAGIYTVTITDNKGCIKTDTAMVTQPPLLITSKSKTDVNCFAGNNGTATAVASGGTIPYSYLWNTSPSQTTSTATGLTANTYIVRTTDAKGCIVYDTIFVAQPTPLVNTKSKNEVSCYGGNDGTATVIVSGATPPYSYSWNTSPIQTNATANTLTARSYIVTITDGNGCTKNDTVTIYQPLALIASVSKSDLKCYNDSSGAILASASGGTMPYYYNWNTTPKQTTALINQLQIGTYTVTVTDGNGCIDSTNAIITQPSLLSSVISYQDVKCFGGNDGSATIMVNGGTTPYTYKWNNSSNSATNNKITIGKYIVNVSDANGCSLFDSVTISEPTLLEVDANEKTKTCFGFSNGSAFAIAKGGIPPYSYQWNTTPSQTGANAQNLFGGIYIVTVTDSNGCSQDDTVDIGNFPKPNVVVNDVDAICYGKHAELNASGTYTYKWSPSQTLICDSCSTTIAYPKSTTDYRVIGTDINGCADTELVTVNVIPKKDVGVGPNQNICIGEEVTLSANGGESYYWYPDVYFGNISNPTIRPDTTTTYTVIIKENQCFTDTLTQTITVHPQPTINLGPDLKGTPGSSIQLKADIAFADKIRWTPETGLSCYDCLNPVAYLSKTITYIATAYNDYCEAKDDITIRVACDDALFFIPNTFTPNGDGANDRFYPGASGVSKIDIFRVYNRWGEKLFEARDFAPNKEEYGWDGKDKGQPLTPDVYVYYLESRCANGGKVFLKGDISLIR